MNHAVNLWTIAVIFMAGAGFAGNAQSQNAPVPPPPVTRYLGELLDLDAQQAVQNERRALERQEALLSHREPTQVVRPTAEIDVIPVARTLPALIAIYGVDRRVAELVVGANTVRLAAGERDRATGLHLLSIALPCVTVDWEQHRDRICLGSR